METNSSIDDNLWSLNETNFCSIPFIMDMNETQNHTEDLCVAVRSFGPWVEKNCSELLPFICYEGKTHLIPLLLLLLPPNSVQQ